MTEAELYTLCRSIMLPIALVAAAATWAVLEWASDWDQRRREKKESEEQLKMGIHWSQTLDRTMKDRQ